MRILVVGAFSNYCLETSYAKAFKANGHEVFEFDIKKEIKKHTLLGKAGTIMQTHFRVESWIKKANRTLVLKALEFKPDLVVCAGNTDVTYGSLAFLKSISPVKTVLLWPDPLINFDPVTLLTAKMWDAIATFNRATLPVLEQLGFPRAIWVPFAADPTAHYMPVPASAPKTTDLAFIGAWKTERETVLSEIAANFPDLNIKIYGPFWNRISDKRLKKFIDARPVYGKKFSEVVQSSLINLNVIDPVGYPAANMRFYELPIAGGFQLCSECPEQETIFRDGEHLFYYRNNEELASKIAICLKDRQSVQAMALNMQQLVQNEHIYVKRAHELLQLINLAN